MVVSFEDCTAYPLPFSPVGGVGFSVVGVVHGVGDVNTWVSGWAVRVGSTPGIGVGRVVFLFVAICALVVVAMFVFV